MNNLIRSEPEISQAYEIYTLCRHQQIVSHDIKRGDKQLTRTEPYTVGLILLPEKGGVLDQPQRLMTFFEEFMTGERRVFGT